MLTPGITFDHYRIEELIGSGAMGVVYRATDLETDQTVALKLIDEKLSRSKSYQERLTQEAEAAAKIDSPYVIKILDRSDFEDQHYIAMEFISGDDFRQAVKDFDFNQKIDIISQLGQGLKAAHDKELVHLDLKPENIIINEEGQVKILDFGLAKTVNADSVDQYGNIEGTLYYLAPEQLTNETLSYSTDLFSFGVIIYELFSGLKPFEGDYPAAIIYSILHEEPPPLSKANTDIPLWLNDIAMKLLSKTTSDRYAQIHSVLDEIEVGLQTVLEPDKFKLVKTRQTVTVVEVKNLSDDSEWEYFCAGFTDDLINELSRRTDLIISAEPSSTFRRNVKDIFHQCRSDFVVVGSLLKWQEKIRFNLTIYGDDGKSIILGDKYEADATNIFAVLSEAVEKSAAKLEEITGLSSLDVDEFFKTDIAAYDYYLKGKSYYQTNKPEDLKIAEQMFRRALEVDPQLAYAYSGISDVYAFQYMAYYDRSEAKLTMARQEAEKAIEISPELPEAHRSLGRYHMFAGNFPEAEKSFLNAVKFNPKYAIGYRTLSWLKYMTGDSEGAMEWAKLSLKYAPNDVETLLLLGLINRDQRKYTIAMATLHRAIELAPDYGRAYFNLGVVYMKLGVVDVALENFHNAVKFKGDPSAEIMTGYSYLIQDKYDLAREHLDQSIIQGYFPFIANYLLGLIEILTDNNQNAEKFLGKAAAIAEECQTKDKTDPYCRCYRAMALALLGKDAEALPILEELESTVMDNGEVMHDIARGFANLKMYDRAEELLKKALTVYAGPSEKDIKLDPHFRGVDLHL